jgi:hypothetical protein
MSHIHSVFFFVAQLPNAGQGRLIVAVSRSHTHTHARAADLQTSDQLAAEVVTYTTFNTHPCPQRDLNHDPTIKWLRFRPHGHHCSVTYCCSIVAVWHWRDAKENTAGVKMCKILWRLSLHKIVLECLRRQAMYVGITYKWRAFVQTVLQWKINKYYILWVCVTLSYPACQRHAPRYSYIVICGLSGCT